MPVVGIHLSEAMFAGTGQVQRIRGTDDDVCRQVANRNARRLDESGGHRQPIPDGVAVIGSQNRKHRIEGATVKSLFSNRAFDRSGKLESPKRTAGRALMLMKQFTDG
jgi:hypothetical protein